MSRSDPIVLGAVLVLAISTPGRAQVRPDAIDQARKGTALVTFGTVWAWKGSAFCIDKSGLYLTNGRLVEQAVNENAELCLTVDTGLTTRRTYSAKVVRYDTRLDLALLQADRDPIRMVYQHSDDIARVPPEGEPGPPLTPLELGDESELIELAEVVALGCPLGPRPPSELSKFPAMAATRSHITALRKDRGQLLSVQIDGQLDAGNVGGPVLDSSGRVIGVLARMVNGARINLAIPIGLVREFLAAPGLIFPLNSVRPDELPRPTTWTFYLRPSGPDSGLPEGVSVTVTLEGEPGKSRTLTADPADAGSFKLSFIPFPDGVEKMLGLKIRAGNGSLLYVHMKDREVTVGSTPIKLSQIKLIYGGARPYVNTQDGKSIVGQVDGLGEVRKDYSGVPVANYDLRRASDIFVWTLPSQPDLTVQAEARQGRKVLATIRKRIEVAENPRRPNPPASQPGPR